MRLSWNKTVSWGGALLLALTACSTGQPSEQSTDEPVTPPGSDQPKILLDTPAGKSAVAGKRIWQVDAGFSKTDGYKVSVVDRWFLASAIDTVDPTVTVAILGVTASGEVLNRFKIHESSGWPVVSLIDKKPVVTVATRSTGKNGFDQVVMLDRDGSHLWAKSGSALGQVPGTSPNSSTLVVDSVDDDRVVVRIIPQVRTQFREADIVVLKSATGKESWRPQESTQLRSIYVENGILLANFHADGDEDELSDRVRAWRLRTGEHQFDFPISDESPVVQLCAHVLPDREVLLCGKRSEEDSGGEKSWRGTVVVVGRDGDEIWRADDIFDLPSLDQQTQTAGFQAADGSLQGVDAATGEQRWRWSPDKTWGTQAALRVGYGGWLIGHAGPETLTLKARNGKVVLVGDYFRLNDKHRSDNIYLDIRGKKLEAFTGPSAPVGLGRDDKADIVYVASTK